jgi:hypothetical protein
LTVPAGKFKLLTVPAGKFKLLTVPAVASWKI